MNDGFGLSGSSRHGTNSRYRSGCVCDKCKAAHSAYQQRWASGNYAGISDLSEFMRSLGWDKAIPRPIPAVFVERWNREHPDRPYVGAT